MNAMQTYRNLRRARRAAARIRSGEGSFPIAEAFFMSGPTRELLDALYDLEILRPGDLDRVSERGPLTSVA